MTPSWTSERGQSLVMALGILVVLAITVGATASYTASNTRSAAMSDGRLAARTYSESSVNDAIAVLAQRIRAGLDPSAANVLGCAGATGATDTNGPSNCTTPAPLLFCLNGSTNCLAGNAGTASVYGYYSGTNATTYLSRTIPAASWLIVATGYASDPAIGSVTSHTVFAVVAVNPLNSGNVASVWNHVFVTSPLVPGVCALDWSGNNISANVPVYVIGNLCLGSSSINESGQPVDVMVGGYLYLAGGGVGSTASVTSGVVVGGCSASKNGSGATPCTNGLWNFHVKSTDTFISRGAPEETTSDIQNDYSSFDPGPAHPCAAGFNPYVPLPSSVFDGNGIYDNSVGTVTLTPGFSYTCNSTRGATVGQLQWNNTTRVLSITGSVFIDGSLLINQSLTYTGVGVIEVSGTVTVSGNGRTVCAVASCSISNWQGQTGNNQMLTLASLASNTTAVSFDNNNQTFQGSLWTQPSSSLTFLKNGDSLQGPMSIGKFDSTFNNASLQPLPVIKNMPVGAPVPPNTGVTLGVPVYVP
jgi:Tfp pilus assembly protein PilX